MGHHHIKWAIMPHQGALGSETVRAAYNFNHPMRLVSLVDDNPAKEIFNAVHLTGGKSLILDVVKRGEDDEDVSRGELTTRSGQSIILRIYESLGGKTRGAIETTLPIKKVYRTNVLEDDLESVEMHGKNKIRVPIELRPFEVATYRLQL
jgi:alpha-mannosidase